ncbi:MAG: hypothetical protein HMLIMOIP_001686 [Candidatus Nitrosomirales archaeon]|jgi:hypothetical protein
MPKLPPITKPKLIKVGGRTWSITKQLQANLQLQDKIGLQSLTLGTIVQNALDLYVSYLRYTHIIDPSIYFDKVDKTITEAKTYEQLTEQDKRTLELFDKIKEGEIAVPDFMPKAELK